MSISTEIARSIRAFRLFTFTVPKGRVARQAWQFVIGLWSGIILFWGAVILYVLLRG